MIKIIVPGDLGNMAELKRLAIASAKEKLGDRTIKLTKVSGKAGDNKVVFKAA